MQKRTLLIAACLLSVMASYGAVKFPRDSFDHTSIPAAVEKATKEKKPVAYIITNKETTCGLASGASKAFLDAIGRRCAIVYLKVGVNYTASLADEVKKAIPKDRYYPSMMILSPDHSQTLVSVSYSEYKKDPKGTVRKIKKALGGYKVPK